MIDWIRPEDFLWLTGVGTMILTTAVENLSSKYKPWSYLGKKIGKSVNGEIIEKLDELEVKVGKLEQMDKQQNEERDRERALEARRRILRFADSCRRKEKHSEEYFNNILEDISFYKDYCTEHPLFENEKAVIAISVIKSAYRHCYDNDDFL